MTAGIDFYDEDAQVCIDCQGKSYGWLRCATCLVAREMSKTESRPVELVGTLFEEAS